MVEVELWRAVKDSADAADLNAYLDAYPDGKFSAVAHNRLRRMESHSSSGAPDVAASPIGQGSVQHPWDGEWEGRRGECKSGLDAHRYGEREISATVDGGVAYVQMEYLSSGGIHSFTTNIGPRGRFVYRGIPHSQSNRYGETWEFVGQAQAGRISGTWGMFGCKGGEWFLKRVAEK